MAFNDENAEEMEKIREESHDEGLAMDMRGPLAEKIGQAWATYRTHDAAKSLRN
jgi:hypothetical protein